MELLQLFDDLTEKNIIISLNGKDLKLQYEEENISDELLKKIKNNKEKIIAYLKQNEERNNGMDSKPPVPMNFSLFYFSSKKGHITNKYNLLLRSVEYADSNNFTGVWLPERHFHEFGGIFPNPSVLGAALSTITHNLEIRSGSIVLPTHDVLRVAEEWSVVDNLSGGRVSLSIASGWNVNDFVLMPKNFSQRHANMYKQIEDLKLLWKGGTLKRTNGNNREIEVKVFPRPLQSELSIWITSVGSSETFRSAGKLGAGVLTHLLGQDMQDLKRNVAIYKEAFIKSGHPLEKAKVAIMLHTHIGADIQKVKENVKEPFKEYLRSNTSLVKSRSQELEKEVIDESDLEDLLELAFERYWQTSALIGTEESCGNMVRELSAIGISEIACLIDFGVDDEKVIDGLEYLNRLKETQSLPYN